MNSVELPKGLYMVNNFISSAEEKILLDFLDSQKWNNTLKRRTQHYGYEYDYTKVTLNAAERIPDFLSPLLKRVSSYIEADQIIVNEYLPGQGISKHIDNKILFGDVVLSLSMGSNCVMVLERGTTKFNYLLQRRSLLILSDESRNEWFHSIPARKKDDGVLRDRRVSLTFRTVLKK